MGHLIRDRNAKFTRSFDDLCASTGAHVMPTPDRAPNANATAHAHAHAERWVGTARREYLHHLLIVGPRHLHHVLSEFIDHDNSHRPHRAFDLSAPHPPPASKSDPSARNHIVRRDVVWRLRGEVGAALLADLVRERDDVTLVSTTDFFPPLVDDPADFGAIAAAKARSDVCAMGGRVVLALNVAALPERLPREAVAAIFAAAAEVVAGGERQGLRHRRCLPPSSASPQQVHRKPGRHRSAPVRRRC